MKAVVQLIVSYKSLTLALVSFKAIAGDLEVRGLEVEAEEHVTSNWRCIYVWSCGQLYFEATHINFS